jgi:hypothetical protein
MLALSANLECFGSKTEQFTHFSKFADSYKPQFDFTSSFKRHLAGF